MVVQKAPGTVFLIVGTKMNKGPEMGKVIIFLEVSGFAQAEEENMYVLKGRSMQRRGVDYVARALKIHKDLDFVL